MPRANKPTPAEQVRAILEAAQHPLSRLDDEDAAAGGDSGEGEPGTGPAPDDAGIDPETVAWCAGLDHSDTDNARRLKAHFGDDLKVMAQAQARTPAYVSWDGHRWDAELGNPRALAIAQKLGGRIALEVQYLTFTHDQQKLVDRAKAVLEKPGDDRTEDEQRLVVAVYGKQGIVAKLDKRVERRMSHAVTSKNKGRLEAMLACLAPHVMAEPDAFNADPWRFATFDGKAGNTLRFVRVAAPNPAFADPDDTRENLPETVNVVRLEAAKGHSRADLITVLLPVGYDAAASCPNWLAFVERFLPVPEVRDMVQVAAGLGLLGETVQRLFFHYGAGANGKSVFLEVITRVLGDLATTLPSESFFGEAKGGGGANPDLARLYGRRFLRVQELPEGEQLREDLVKKLTGGEAISVRNLFQGYFDFRPIFTAHMSGNGYPKITGTDNGIWRRIAVVHWPVSIPEAEQRPFDEVVASLLAEAPGILNWLIDGAKRYLSNGLDVPDAVRSATKEYRDTMDPLSGFINTCLDITKQYEDMILGQEFYRLYCRWCATMAIKPAGGRWFGDQMTRRAEALGILKKAPSSVEYHGVRVKWWPPEVPEGASDYEAHRR